MKRKLFISLLSTVGGLAIIGSGFSAWYFGNDTVAGANSDISVIVEPLASQLGTITADDTTKYNLILDQGGYRNKENLDAGISIKNETDYVQTIGATYTLTKDNIENVYNAGLVGTFTAIVTIKSDLAKYINFKDSFNDTNVTSSNIKTDNTTGDFVRTFTKTVEITNDYTNDVTSTFTFHVDTNSETLVNEGFIYTSKPKTKDDYSNGISKLSGNLINFTYSFEFKAK